MQRWLPLEYRECRENQINGWLCPLRNVAGTRDLHEFSNIQREAAQNSPWGLSSLTDAACICWRVSLWVTTLVLCDGSFCPSVFLPGVSALPSVSDLGWPGSAEMGFRTVPGLLSLPCHQCKDKDHCYSMVIFLLPCWTTCFPRAELTPGRCLWGANRSPRVNIGHKVKQHWSQHALPSTWPAPLQPDF